MTVAPIDRASLGAFSVWRGSAAGAPSTDIPFRRSYVRALLPRLERKAGIEKRVHPHGLRHTCAAELVIEGAPVPLIQQQLGPCQPAHDDGLPASHRDCGSGREYAHAELDSVATVLCSKDMAARERCHTAQEHQSGSYLENCSYVSLGMKTYLSL
jgi:hypothetical protein